MVTYSSLYQVLVIGNLKRNTVYFYQIDKQTILKTLDVYPLL